MGVASFTVGSGPYTTVLLHGFLGTGKNLRTLAQQWSARQPERTIWVPDLPAHGESAIPTQPGTQGLAQAILDEMKHRRLAAPYTWAGHSLGGRVALQAAFMTRDATKRVDILDISPSPFDATQTETGDVLAALLHAPSRAPSRIAFREGLVQDGLSPALADWLVMNVTAAGGGEMTWRFDREALARLHAQIAQEDLWPALQSLHVPIRCIRGDRSAYVPNRDAERLAAAGVDVVTLHSGHYLHVDAFEPLLDLLASGLNGEG